jgi:hypothetical protein
MVGLDSVDHGCFLTEPPSDVCTDQCVRSFDMVGHGLTHVVQEG